MGRLPASRRESPLPSESVAMLSASVARVSGSPYHASCLVRSVFLWFLLHRRGLDAALRIGVTRTDGQLEGHAWVEYDGVVINDEQDVADRYAVFDEDPTGIVFA